jgi:hypothetical protein
LVLQWSEAGKLWEIEAPRRPSGSIYLQLAGRRRHFSLVRHVIENVVRDQNVAPSSSTDSVVALPSRTSNVVHQQVSPIHFTSDPAWAHDGPAVRAA